MKILIAGGTGFLGTHLTYELLRQGHEVTVTTRKSPTQLHPQPYRILQWPLQSDEEVTILKQQEAVINLAGASIADGRWTAERKAEIKNSRIRFTDELVDHLRGSAKLRIFLSGSATGFYGDRKSEVLDEESPVGEGFLAEICKAWEKSALELKNKQVRTVLLRTGVVLGRNEGMLSELEPLNKNMAGGTAGSGEQFISWIHVKDWVEAVIFCLKNESMVGPVNLVGPQPVSNRAFTEVYNRLFEKPIQMPAPTFALKLALGEMSSLVLDSQNVRPKKLEAAAFRFRYPYLKEALHDLYDFSEQGNEVHEYFTTQTWIPKPLDEVFTFFSDAQNLEAITPDFLSFHVDKVSTAKIEDGTLIDYSLKIHGVPIKWKTKITNWDPPRCFVDTQLSGPYKRWHHTHTFEELAGGTYMQDFVHYRLPAGVIGRTVSLHFVKKDVEKIFSYRRKKILEIFSDR